MNILEEQRTRVQEGKLVNPSPRPSPTRGEGVNSRVDFSLPLITGLPRSLRSLVMTKKNPTTANATITPHPDPVLKLLHAPQTRAFSPLGLSALAVPLFGLALLRPYAISLSHKGRGRKKCAFTLAEVLITLGIIGVVAAMTLPTLIENHKTRRIITELKRTYSVLSQATNFAVAELGTPDNWGLSNNNDIWNIFDKYMKFDKPPKGHDVRLAGGDVRVRYYHRANECNYWLPKNNGCGDLDIRIKGHSGIFQFFLTKEGFLIPYGTEGYSNYWFSFEAYKAGRCLACQTAWVLSFENLDYLKCPEKLSWNGKHKCSE